MLYVGLSACTRDVCIGPGVALRSAPGCSMFRFQRDCFATGGDAVSRLSDAYFLALLSPTV